jgi:hypothetical protein
MFLVMVLESEQWNVFVLTVVAIWLPLDLLHIWKNAWAWEGIAVALQAGGTVQDILKGLYNTHYIFISGLLGISLD